MKTRFFLIVILMILLFGAWTYLAHSEQESLIQNYEDLARLPVYTYVNDTALVPLLLEKLRQIPDLDSLRHDSGFQAAEELITAYDLPLTESEIAGYRFPDVITITFPPSEQGIQAKTRVMEVLRADLPEEDIDSQSTVYARLIQSLERKKSNWLIYFSLLSIMMLFLLINVPMSFELKLYHRQVRSSRSVVDMMRLKKSRMKRRWLLMILPPALPILLYYALGYFKLWENCNLWRSFVMMGLVSIAGSLSYYFSFRSYEQEDVLSLPEPIATPVPTPEEHDA
ncbi:MAG: hypothetical protein PHT37_06490 [Candidatus Cloacimonetes bacterium]|jgi:hypothetical protein|nr:hypothetical protein [Candidatus Cloacimonadota bacterium]MDD4277517.1 hypothetical protein [Candidatus Cloacimonadota bacterium]MDY0326259.1 hypothetical protein [Candidatus Cloacimonadaceae bacterium]